MMLVIVAPVGSSSSLLVLQLLFFFFYYPRLFLALAANCSFKADTRAPEWWWRWSGGGSCAHISKQVLKTH